jgi:hypothetical protein
VPTSPAAEFAQSATTPLSLQARIGFNHQDLDGWDVTVFGGSEHGKGSVRPGSAWLREGDSFLVGRERSFVVPPNPAPVVFTYTDLRLDPTDPGSVNDAFEASLVDGQGRTLVHSFAGGRDAYLNVAEDVGRATGPGAAESGGAVKTVTLDVSEVLPGTEATIRFRLVNNPRVRGCRELPGDPDGHRRARRVRRRRVRCHRDR